MEQLELSYTTGGNLKFNSLWKTLSHLLIKLNIYLPCDPEISLLGIYPREMDTYVPSYKDLDVIVIVALLIIVKTWKYPKCQSKKNYG